MELRVLRYFLTVARKGSITGAATELHLSQPALSKQLKDLEAEFGKPLLVREPRGVALTEGGMLLRRRAQEIVDLADKTEAELTADEESVEGDVHIGCGETQGMRFIARAAHEVRERYPHVRFHLFSGNSVEVAERLDKGLVDFGLFVGFSDTGRYSQLDLPRADELGLLVRCDHPLASRDFVEPADLANVPLLVSRQSLERDEFIGWLGHPMEELDIAGTYNLVFNASIMVREGCGCAVCLDGLVETSGESDVRFVPLAPKAESHLTVAWKKYPAFSKPAERFLDALRRTACRAEPV